MRKSNIINLPIEHPAIGEDNAFWLIAVSSGIKDDYSCEYDTGNGWWKLTVKSRTFHGAEMLIEKCRHILGWDIPTERKEAAEQ